MVGSLAELIGSVRMNRPVDLWAVPEGEVVLGNYLIAENRLIVESVHENFDRQWMKSWEEERGPSFGGIAANDLLLIDGGRRVLVQPTRGDIEVRSESVYLFQYTYDHNFHHFIFGALPRLRHFITNRMDKSLLLVRTDTPEYQREMIRSLVSEEYWLSIDPSTEYRFREVWIASFYNRTSIKSVSKFYTDTYGGQVKMNKPAPPLIFLSRSDSSQKRPVKNALALEGLFESFGFSSVSTSEMALEDRLCKFGRAKVLAGVFSAGFANLVFSPRCELVIFIEHPLYKIPWQYVELCSSRNVRLIVVRPPPLSGLLWKISVRIASHFRRFSVPKADSWPWRVSLRQLDLKLSRLLGSAQSKI